MQNPVFHPRAAFDGQRNMFRSTALDLPNQGGNFKVYFPNKEAPKRKEVKVKITRVATINPQYAHFVRDWSDSLIYYYSSLQAVINGENDYGSESLTALTLLNVLIRMKPIM